LPADFGEPFGININKNNELRHTYCHCVK
jgi:hypothetical protein